MITLCQKSTRNFKFQNLGDVRVGSQQGCAFVKSVPGFVNSKGKEERTCLSYSLLSGLSLLLSPPFTSPFICIYAYIQHFLSISVVLFHWSYLKKQSSEQWFSKCSLQTNRVHITWRSIRNENSQAYSAYIESETRGIVPTILFLISFPDDSESLKTRDSIMAQFQCCGSGFTRSCVCEAPNVFRAMEVRNDDIVTGIQFSHEQNNI